MNKINIAIIGDGGVGKTSIINRLATGDYTNKTEADKITYDNFQFNVVPLHRADCVVLVFDVTNPTTYNNLSIDGIKVPVLLVGNKIDAKNRKVLAKHIKFHRTHKLTYFEYSALSCYNCEKPLLWAMEVLGLSYLHMRFTIIDPPAIGQLDCVKYLSELPPSLKSGQVV